MGTCNLNNTLALAGLYLCFVLLISGETDVTCPGPTNFYKEIGCFPVFKNSDAKCPKKYNCDHLEDLPTDKCFINGHTYEIDEELRAEDANPCDIGCFCAEGRTGPAEFICAVVDCYFPQTPGCYLKRNATACCGGIEVCPKRDEDRATCIVDGKTYRDGEFFQPAEEPNKRCFCGEGYTGENVEPFCVDVKPSSCGTMLRRSREIREKCAPIYHSTDSPATNCPVQFRCQNDKDVVIPAVPNPSNKSKRRCSHNHSGMQCKFGNLTMNVGDELKQATNYDSVCVKCVCEVPPVPTCRRLSREVCDVTKHPKF